MFASRRAWSHGAAQHPSRGIVGGVGGYLWFRLQSVRWAGPKREGAPASGRSAAQEWGRTLLELHARSAPLPVARARTLGLPICSPADRERLRAAPVAREDRELHAQ